MFSKSSSLVECNFHKNQNCFVILNSLDGDKAVLEIEYNNGRKAFFSTVSASGLKNDFYINSIYAKQLGINEGSQVSGNY